mmetsp:Transcript_97458/g.275693  ORF Transcript_97458/g.275693 Transcript_97458/m.275693 type:complete len:396 (+) Transcript_97458:1957-3144(+)
MGSHCRRVHRQGRLQLRTNVIVRLWRNGAQFLDHLAHSAERMQLPFPSCFVLLLALFSGLVLAPSLFLPFTALFLLTPSFLLAALRLAPARLLLASPHLVFATPRLLGLPTPRVLLTASLFFRLATPVHIPVPSAPLFVVLAPLMPEVVARPSAGTAVREAWGQPQHGVDGAIPRHAPPSRRRQWRARRVVRPNLVATDLRSEPPTVQARAVATIPKVDEHADAPPLLRIDRSAVVGGRCREVALDDIRYRRVEGPCATHRRAVAHRAACGDRHWRDLAAEESGRGTPTGPACLVRRRWRWRHGMVAPTTRIAAIGIPGFAAVAAPGISAISTPGLTTIPAPRVATKRGPALATSFDSAATGRVARPAMIRHWHAPSRPFARARMWRNRLAGAKT